MEQKTQKRDADFVQMSLNFPFQLIAEMQTHHLQSGSLVPANLVQFAVVGQ